MKCKVTYLYHSGYFVELEDCCLLFDYYKGKLPDFDHHKPLYIFVSHAHEDHYQKKIFAFMKTYPHVTCILSDDIQTNENVCHMHASQILKLDTLRIETFPSSDEGVAYLVEVNGINIYHAGDLNWWHWQDENTDVENEEAKALFYHGIEKLKHRHIDIAFLVLDPRQDEAFYYGMDAYLCEMDIDYVFPMHMWKKYKIVEKMKRLTQSVGYRDKIMEIKEENQQFTIEV